MPFLATMRAQSPFRFQSNGCLARTARVSISNDFRKDARKVIIHGKGREDRPTLKHHPIRYCGLRSSAGPLVNVDWVQCRGSTPVMSQTSEKSAITKLDVDRRTAPADRNLHGRSARFSIQCHQPFGKPHLSEWQACKLRMEDVASKDGAESQTHGRLSRGRATGCPVPANLTQKPRLLEGNV